MKRILWSLQILLIIFGSLSFMTACAPNKNKGGDSEKGIAYYDIYFEMDPAQSIFRSKQSVSITNDLVDDRRLSIYLNSNLIIDQLTLEDEAGNNLAIENWEKVADNSIEYWWGQSETSEIEIRTFDKTPSTGNLVVNVEYHLPGNSFQDGLPSNLYELFVSPQGSHAGGPESGAFVMVSGTLEAPLRMTIKHPQSLLCAVPGEIADQTIKDGFIVEAFQTEQPYDPSFSCAPYQLIKKEIQGLSIDIYAQESAEISQDFIETAGSIFQFYVDNFGVPAAQTFKIVFPELLPNDGGGESNGNLILLADIKPFLGYSNDPEAKEIYTQLIAHEGYHLWNAWSIYWQGSLKEWWVEGGANFMAVWIQESFLGKEIAANNRKQQLEFFTDEKGYLHKHNLAKLDENWFDDYTLVYNYGAMVWEQLRLEIGSEQLLAGLKDFYQMNRNQTVSSETFVPYLQKYTDIDVESIIGQWTEHNAMIDLEIQDVELQQLDNQYEVNIRVKYSADRDYKINTELGYKSNIDDDWSLIDLNLSKTGTQTIHFSSAQQPIFIQIDPDYRVPQIEPGNNGWVADDTF